MISDITKGQIEDLRFTNRPLVICDVDEVVVHFTRDLETYLDRHGLWLDFASFALNGNIRHRQDNAPASDQRVAELIASFFAERTLHLEPVDGAIEALHHFAETSDVIMLTNLPHSAGDHRRENLAGMGLTYPVVTNEGPKGPAIAELLSRAGQPAVFIDDNPQYLSSAYEHAPDIHLIHFMHDDRFGRHLPPVDYVSLRTHTWDEAKPHIAGLLKGAP